MRPRSRHITCDLGGTLVTMGGVDADGSPSVSIERLDGGADAWRTVALENPRPRLDAVCLSRRTYIDVLGGRAGPDGPATPAWQRFDLGDGPRVRRGPGLGRPRAGAIIKRIGVAAADRIAFLVIGGEDAGAEGPATVDLVVPSQPFGSPQSIYTYALPEGIGGRRMHMVVNRAVSADPTVPGNLLDREVVVLGGVDADTGQGLDEVLVFSLDP